MIYKIKWHYNLPYNLNSDAVVERLHLILLEYIRTYWPDQNQAIKKS